MISNLRTRFTAVSCLGSLLLFAATTTLWAQSGVGTIQGTVQDSSSAAIPGASVQALNQATGVSLETTTNSEGFYAIKGLFAGTYAVTVSAPGMKKSETTVTLQSGQVLVSNRQLALGDVSEKVTVSSETVQLATYDSGTVNTQLDAARISTLPQNGRNVLGLAQNTVPGLEAGGTRANGLMGEAMEYSLDGAPMTNRNFGSAGNTAQSTLPDPDAVQEIRFETMNSNSQFATPATVLLTTKSGTNQFHGSMFETARNNYFGIARARQDPANFAAPKLIRNEFGASVGGPISIPGLYDGKNRTFFFFAYERFALRRAQQQLMYVPTVAMRTGDFSGLVNNAGVLQRLYDPNSTQSAANNYARTLFPNNQIPLTRISPLAKTLLAATPLPTSADNPMVNFNLNGQNPTTQTVPNYSVRLDHVFNDKNRGYFRFTDIRQQQQALRNYPSASPANIETSELPAGATGYQAIPVQTISGALGYSKVFSPTLFSETILSMQWQRMYVVGNDVSMQNYEKQFGLPNSLGNVGFPAIGSGLFMPYGGSQWYYGMSQRVQTLDENLNKIWGKHQFAFGFRIRREGFGYLSDRSVDEVQYTNQATGIYDPTTGVNYGVLANTGNQNADFFLGAASSYSERRNAPFNICSLMEYDTYFQDNWRVSKRLTLNLGLRWEAHPAVHAANDYMATFDIKNDALALPRPLDYYVQAGLTSNALLTNLRNLGVKFETFEQGGLPERGIAGANANFLPRIGFAYQPSFGKGGTVIRGGYGEYIYPVPVRNSIRYLTSGYPFTAGYSQSYVSAAQSPDGLPNSLLRGPLNVITGANSSNVVDTNSVNALLPGIGAGTVMSAYYPPARVQESNFTIEQPFKDGSVFRASYVYTHGKNLDQNYQINDQPSAYVWQTRTGTTVPTGTFANVATRPYDNRTWGGITQSTKFGFSNNSALQFNYQRPFRKGFAYQIFYVYSRAFRLGGNTFRDNILYPAELYAPGVIPQGMNVGTKFEPSAEFNRWQNYRADTAIPQNRVSFNGLVDVPFGKGRRFLKNSNRFVDALLGGYQVAFVGTMVSQSFQVANTNWGATNPITLYKNSQKVKDCRSGVCRDAYMWFNGYLAPTVINTANGVQGVPDSYKPYLAPINNTPGQTNYGNNNVSVLLANGQTVTTAYSPGPAGANMYNAMVLQGPKNFQTDISLYKEFSFGERYKLRFNVDAFNAFNIQGLVNPNTSDGIQQLQSSYWTPRQIQLT
ncbi:MAG: carboxypeptidase regulatory-like domain-containing protein, partial [Acidobacteria bacterium]|nr:carboxypeptidase regulatory-like domain-containing protein [Acidobacteriota bacterium]